MIIGTIEGSVVSWASLKEKPTYLNLSGGVMNGFNNLGKFVGSYYEGDDNALLKPLIWSSKNDVNPATLNLDDGTSGYE